MVFVAGALPPHPHKEVSFLDFVHCERAAFKKLKVFGVPFLKKGDKRSLTTQDTKDTLLLLCYLPEKNGSGWESNPPSLGKQPTTDFEDRGIHRDTTTPMMSVYYNTVLG